jgi:hypothetical protein
MKLTLVPQNTDIQHPGGINNRCRCCKTFSSPLAKLECFSLKKILANLTLTYQPQLDM